MRKLPPPPVDNPGENRRASVDSPAHTPLHGTLADSHPQPQSLTRKERIRAGVFIAAWLTLSGFVLWGFLELAP